MAYGEQKNDTVYSSSYKPPSKGWISHIPSSCVPYVQLTRLVSPAPVFLIYFPHLFGTLHAASLVDSEPFHVFKTNLLLFFGSIFYSNAAHIWNDLIDAPLDRLVTRTVHRPIPRGAVSPTAAITFAATQSLAAAVFFLPLPPACILYSIPAIAGSVFYPYAKRINNYPQIVLGLIIAWGIVMGEVAMGLDPLESTKTTASIGCLFLASTLWTVIYDTIYAHQDLDDDIKVGIKSLAVLFRGSAKQLLWSLLGALLCFLVAGGVLSGMGSAYFACSVVGTAITLGNMIQKVQLNRAESCLWWFGKGFWFAGFAMAMGLLAQYKFPPGSSYPSTARHRS